MGKIIGRSLKIEELCPKCGKSYIESLYCWPSLDGEEPMRCVTDKIYIHKFIPGSDLVVSRIVH